MTLNKIIIISFGLLFSKGSLAQIQIGGEETTKKEQTSVSVKSEKVKKEKSVDSTKYTTDIFIGTGVMSTFRSLTPNSNELFAKPLGERQEEKAMVKPSVQIGIRKKLNGFLQLEGSVTYFQSGERYSYSAPDTLHKYSVTYNELGVGLKLFYYKNVQKVDFLVGAGVMPTFRMKNKRKDEFETTAGKEVNTEERSKEGLNTIGFNLLINAGVQYNFHPRLGVFAFFEYRQSLTNMYTKYSPFIYKGYGIGANLGLTFKI